MSSDLNDCCVICDPVDTISSTSIQQYNKLLSVSSTRHIIASVIGSTTSTILLNPLNVIKLRLQYAIPQKHAISSSLATLSIQQTALGVYKSHGMIGFYSGVGVSLVQSLPSTVIYMTTYERIKLFFEKEKEILQHSYFRNDNNNNNNNNISNNNNNITNKISSTLFHLSPAFAGGFARIFTVSIIAPLELIRTIRTSGSSNDKPLKIARDIIQSHGFRGLYGGWASTVLRDTPFSMIYWLTFEQSRPILSNLITSPSFNHSSLSYSLQRDSNPTHYSTVVNFLSGAMSGLCAAMLTHPFDVLKTQQQLGLAKIKDVMMSRPLDMCICIEPCTTHKMRSVGDNSIVKRLGVIYREGGIVGLYRGLSMRLMTVIPSGAIMITIYEIVKNMQIIETS